MTQVTRIAKIKKPKHSKVNPVSEQDTHVPVDVHRHDIPSHMPRVRSGIHHSNEVWGNRVFSEGDRKHPNAKPD